MLTKVFRVLVLTVVFAAGSSTFAQTNRPAELQQLANDFGFQINMLRDFDGRAAEERTRALAVALDRWNSSTRTDADYQTMKTWLEGAIQSTMPGTKKPLPQLPWFEERLTEAVELPLPNEPATAQPQPEPQTIPLPQPTHTAEEEAAVVSSIAQSPAATTAKKPQPEAEASFWDRHPGAKPIDMGNPFEDDRSVAAATPKTPRVAMRPTGFSSTTDADSDVGINTAELGARVRGYVHGLKGVEARLVASPDMSLDELLAVVRELRQLANQREFVGMYLDVVALDSPDKAADLPSTNHAKAMVSGRLERLRQTDQGHGPAIDSLQSMLSEL